MAGTTTIGMLKAILSADAAQFSAAMAEASKDVQGLAAKLQKDLEPSQRAVNAVVRDFLGGDELRRAQTYAAAVEKIGDINQLTAADQKKVNEAMQAAIERYRMLGQEAPANLKAIEEATRKVGVQTADIAPQANKATEAFSLMKRAVVGIGLARLAGEAIEFGSHLVDLSNATGLTTDELQRLNFAGAQVGVGLDQISRGVNKLQAELVGGDKGTVAAVEKLGLNLNALRGMSPGAMFETIAAAVARIPDPAERTAVAMQLLGKSGIELLPLLTQNLQELEKGVEVMSKRTIENLDRVDDAWSRAKIAALNGAGELLAAATSFEAASDMITRNSIDTQGKLLAQDVDAQIGSLTKAAGAGVTWGKSLKDLTVVLPTVTEATNQWNKATSVDAGMKKQIAAAEAWRERVAALANQLSGADLRKQFDLVTAALESLAARGLEPAAQELPGLIKQLEAFRKAGIALPPIYKDAWVQLAAWNELQGKVTANGKDLLANFENLAPAVKAAGDAFTAADKAIDAWWQSVSGKRAGTNPNDVLKFFGGIRISVDDLDKQIPPLVKHTDEWHKSLSDLARGFEQLANVSDGSMADIAREIGEIVAAMDLAARASDGMKAGFDKLGDGKTSTVQGLTEIAAAASSAWAAIMGATDSTSKEKNILGGAAAGAQAGLAFAAMTGGWSIAIGAGIGAIVGALRDGHKKARAEVEKWAEEMFGGFEKLHDLLLAMSRDDLWVKVTQGSPEDNLNAVKQINELVGLMKTYGLTLNDLRTPHDNFAQSLKDITENYRKLKEIGFGDAAIARGMKDGLNDILRSAIDLGEKIPPALQPLLEALIKGGGLADDVARKLLGIDAPDVAPWRDMEAIAKEFGIDVEALGPAFRSAKLGETADEFAKKFQLLVDHGADVNAVIAGMGTSAQDFLTQALKWGIELPASMKPVLETLLKTGGLVDENGVKLEDLSRVQFAPDLKDQIKELIEALKDFIDEIKNGVGGLGELARTHVSPIVVPWHFEQQGINPGDQPDLGPQPTPGDGTAASVALAASGIGATAQASSTGVVMLDGRAVGTFILPHIVNETKRLQLTR